MKVRPSILFIGDSITDCGRKDDEEGIGWGYVRLIRDYLIATNPAGCPQVINKGINGNRVTDLADRWPKDVIEMSADYVSISIGINDVWRQLDQPDIEQIHPERFQKVYQALLDDLKQSSKVVIPVLMEPTVIEEDVNSAGNLKLKQYVEIVRSLAEKNDGILVPTHEAFLSYLVKNQTHCLTTDGVHMNSTGNMLMAHTWLKSVLAHLKYTAA
ncbi:Lysophospholipase L1 [Sediminibacillus albus]|uniref:Lysophospholipase L1 n=2 Tax=Sediminibacillus albus TaxID=407036 RepID=A0A1G9AP45_9BACI|nr:Lysophospholipase L1 [Sediminibacillus albus]